jgi:hypothetical protein
MIDSLQHLAFLEFRAKRLLVLQMEVHLFSDNFLHQGTLRFNLVFKLLKQRFRLFLRLEDFILYLPDLGPDHLVFICLTAVTLLDASHELYGFPNCSVLQVSLDFESHHPLLQHLHLTEILELGLNAVGYRRELLSRWQSLSLSCLNVNV